MRGYLRTFSLCFEFGKTTEATEPFPGIGFQTTNERRSPDDLPRSEVKQSNPISGYYRPDRGDHKRSFHHAAKQIFRFTPDIAGCAARLTRCFGLAFNLFDSIVAVYLLLNIDQRPLSW